MVSLYIKHQDCNGTNRRCNWVAIFKPVLQPMAIPNCHYNLLSLWVMRPPPPLCAPRTRPFNPTWFSIAACRIRSVTGQVINLVMFDTTTSWASRITQQLNATKGTLQDAIEDTRYVFNDETHHIRELNSRSCSLTTRLTEVEVRLVDEISSQMVAHLHVVLG